MPSLIDALPGQTLPIAEVTSTLANMWHVERDEGREPPSEFRASQMNLILHFGSDVTEEEARVQFDAAILFAQRYPCRIIVLCPEEDKEAEKHLLEAKLYSQCFIGDAQRQMCCCEALILSYFTKQPDFLENQVSVWLENDLPTYYWFFKVPTEWMSERFLPFIKNCRRVAYDSSVEKNDYSSFKWPEGIIAYDLVHARLLPMRQGMGQYLSSFSPEQIANGLNNISIRHTAAFHGEATCLATWLEACVRECLPPKQSDSFNVQLEALNSDEAIALDVRFEYADTEKTFRWTYDPVQRLASITCNFGYGLNTTPIRIKLLDPAKTLAEAFFFDPNVYSS